MLLLENLFVQLMTLWISRYKTGSMNSLLHGGINPLEKKGRSLVVQDDSNTQLSLRSYRVTSSLWNGIVMLLVRKIKTTCNRSFGHRGQLRHVCNIFNPTHFSIFWLWQSKFPPISLFQCQPGFCSTHLCVCKLVWSWIQLKYFSFES